MQAEFKVPRLEEGVSELCWKLFEVTKARDALGNQVKKIPQLEAEVANLKHSNAVQRSVHQSETERLHEAHRLEIERLRQEYTAQLEIKDSFNATEKVCVLSELQADYQRMMSRVFEPLLGKTMEAYIYDILVKSNS